MNNEDLKNRLSSLKEKIELIKEDGKRIKEISEKEIKKISDEEIIEEEIKEIFETKARINKSIEDKNKEIEKIEFLLKTKLDNKGKQNIENNIKSLEVELRSLEEEIKLKIKIREIADILCEKYIKNHNKEHTIKLYAFINKMYNHYLKEEKDRSFHKFIFENSKRNSVEIKYDNFDIFELNILLFYTCFSNMKEVNKKLFFDIFREVDKILPPISTSLHPINKSIAKDQDNSTIEQQSQKTVIHQTPSQELLGSLKGANSKLEEKELLNSKAFKR